MYKTAIITLVLTISSFALTLDQVRNDLKKSSFAKDSIEMDIRTTINAMGSTQSISIYIVQKGTSKIYTEINAAFVNQRSIVNGSKMKVIDLKTNKSQVVPYNGEALEAMSYVQFNPLDAGEWENPKYVSENLYSIKGRKGFLYYNSKKKRIEKYELEPKLIASHGHTIFHRPEEKYTLQIGDGQQIADATSIMTINDFRTEDVTKGGQGAPLVPIGDRHLFAEFPICLNIGGIANVSYEMNDKRIAYDICIANQLLNYLSNKLGYDYDNNGNFASQGSVNQDLFDKLNDNPYYGKSHPKSLGREFFEEVQHKLVDDSKLDVKDLLRTATEHIAFQIAKSTEQLEKSKMLITGGGAKNTFLINRICDLSKHEIIIPDTTIIDYKEALIFAFLGVLKYERKTNVLSSVTGAASDSSSGKIYLPHNNK